MNVVGYSAAGKATEKVQRRAIAQARRGFVALTIDALGQGERRVREYSRSGRPPGNAHQIIGTQAFLAGTHVFLGTIINGTWFFGPIVAGPLMEEVLKPAGLVILCSPGLRL